MTAWSKVTGLDVCVSITEGSTGIAAASGNVLASQHPLASASKSIAQLHSCVSSRQWQEFSPALLFRKCSVLGCRLHLEELLAVIIEHLVNTGNVHLRIWLK